MVPLPLPLLQRALIGSATPRSLVGVFHGLGDSMQTLRPAAEAWSRALPHAAFVLYQAPSRDYFGRQLKGGEFSGDWFAEGSTRAFAVGESDEQHYAATISDRVDHVSAELDAELRRFGLSDDRMALAGFSQGAALSLYTGLRRGCAGALALGGPCQDVATREALLPAAPSESDCRICAVVGDADPYADHAAIAASLARFGGGGGGREREHDGVQVVPGLEHEVGEQSIALGLAFLADLKLDAAEDER